jgi:hypothetical protein
MGITDGIKSTTKKFQAPSIPYVFIRNGGGSIEVGKTGARTPNCVYDPWTLYGWEVRSESTELVGPDKVSRAGYVCDEAGITVALKIQKSERPGPVLSGDVALRDLVNHPMQVFMSASEILQWKVTAKKVPVIYLSNDGQKLEWGGTLRTDGKILTDGPGEPVFRINSRPTEIFNAQTGKTEPGYICHESGQTVEFVRDITILKPDPLPGEVSKPLPAGGATLPAPDKVNVVISFCGAVGKLCSFDRIPDIFDVGQSKRNFWMGLGLGLFVMFVIRLLF